MDNLHYIQMQIIRSLTFKPGTRFSELNQDNISSDQFSYHLKTLLRKGYIDTSDQKYFLTSIGKLYSSHMDTDASRIEKLPKVSVLIIPSKAINGQKEYLIHTRSKEPYFGYSGFITGKIRYGETIEQAARRELNEEAGVTGGEFRYHFTIHEMVYDKKSNKQLEDKFFNVVSFLGIAGKLLDKTEDGSNSWVTEKKFRQMSPLFHNEIDMLDWYLADETGFKEHKYYISEY